VTDRLLLVRHGRSTANFGRVLDTRPPGAPLDELGREQAERLAARLVEWPIRALHASSAVRAQQTAAPLATVLGLPVRIVDGLHEIDAGDLEGRSDPAAMATFNEVYDAWWRGELGTRLPGGESALDLRARFLPALHAIVDGVPDGDVVVVSHGAAVRLAAAALLGDTAETWYVPNAGLVVLKRDADGWVLESWDTAAPVSGDVTAGGEPR
jgi:broad specificity phosphatase PhoE